MAAFKGGLGFGKTLDVMTRECSNKMERKKKETEKTQSVIETQR